MEVLLFLFYEVFKWLVQGDPGNHYATFTKNGLTDPLKEGIWSSFEEMVHEIITEALLPIMVLTFCKCCDKTELDLENIYKNRKSP